MLAWKDPEKRKPQGASSADSKQKAAGRRDRKQAPESKYQGRWGLRAVPAGQKVPHTLARLARPSRAGRGAPAPGGASADAQDSEEAHGVGHARCTCGGERERLRKVREE